MAAEFKAAGDGNATATGGAPLLPTYPATVDGGDVALLQLVWRSAGADPGWAPAGAGWTKIRTQAVGDGGLWQWVFSRECDGTEDGATETVASDGLEVRGARIYTFSGAAGGDTGDFSGDNDQFGSSASVSMPTVTTSVADALAVAFLFMHNDLLTPGSATGETGGDWTEAVAYFDSGLGLDLTIQLQTAAMPTPATISGGTTGLAGSAGWQSLGFAVLPTFVSLVDLSPPPLRLGGASAW